MTPGQALVVYKGEVCLGAGTIVHPGASLFEEQQREELPGALLDG